MYTNQVKLGKIHDIVAGNLTFLLYGGGIGIEKFWVDGLKCNKKIYK